VRVYRLQAPGEPTAAAPAPTLTLPEKPSIAVLAFANMSGDPEQGYLADGIAEDTLTALSRVRWLFVIARQSSFSYKGRAVDVKQIGRELGVRYVVEGSVRKAGNRVRIAAQLIEAETGAHVWADRFDGDLSDIFAVQDEITERIVSAVEPSVQASEIRRARTKPTESLTAYDLYLRALPEYYGQTPETYKRAEDLLRKAIEVDPGYAEALGTLTDSIAGGTLEGFYGDWTRGTIDACQIAARAVAAGPDNSTCLASAAFAYAVLASRFDEAHQLADRALMLHPNSAWVRHRIAGVYVVCGDCDKAIAQLEAARRMNPLETKKAATATFSTLAAALFFARRFEESLEAGRHALSFTPTANTSRRYVAASLGQLGRIEEAQAEVAELLKYFPDASLALFRRHPFRYGWMRELVLDGLRKAGLREE